MSSPRSPAGRLPLGPAAVAREKGREIPPGSLGPTERYVIVEYLAEGGMGAIYLGKRIGVGGFEKQVVLKQLLPEFCSDPQITGLFLQEARLSASLDHQSIVYTMDLVQVAGSYYMVMEYVRGGDLRSLLRRAKRRGMRFSPAAALLIGRDLLDALDYAHTRKLPDGKPLSLIHRDVSPSNVLMSASGDVKLTDFGIAKASTYNTTAYKIRGKVGYMSPEQARGEEIDARSDLFSLAVVLYEVVCGERLFVGNLTQSPALIYGSEIKPPSHHCPGLPPDFDEVLLKALSLPREGRYGTAREFQEALLDVSKRHDLLIGHAEMAHHLREICGPDPDTWLRDEERTGTAMIAPGGDDDDPDGPQEEAEAEVQAADEVAARPPVPRSSRAPILRGPAGGKGGPPRGIGGPADSPRGPAGHPGSPASSKSSPAGSTGGSAGSKSSPAGNTGGPAGSKSGPPSGKSSPGRGTGPTLPLPGEPSGDMTEPTSLMASSLVEVMTAPPPPVEETQPIERQEESELPLLPPVNIAALARKMIPPPPTPGTAAEAAADSQKRQRLRPAPPRRLTDNDDTAAVTAPRPATVRMLTQSDADIPPPPAPPRAFQVTRGRLLLLSLLILLLLGLGIALGMLLSNPRLDSGEPHPPQPHPSAQ